MEKRYWIHEPVKGTQEVYDSSDWFSIMLLWALAKIIVIALIIGIFFLFAWLAK